MKIKSLLAAVSMVALTAGSASALSITSVTPTGAVLANELALPAENVGNITFDIQTDTGNFPAGNNFLISVTLPTGVAVNESVDAGDILTEGGDDASAVIQPSSSGNVLDLLVSIPQTTTVTDTIGFDIPIDLVSCAISGNVSATVTTEAGTNVEEGVATAAAAAAPLAPCESAYNTAVSADADDTVIALVNYVNLSNSPGSGGTLTSTIGLLDAVIDTDVGVDLDGTALTHTSVDEITFDICFEDGSEVTDVTVNGVAGTASADDNTYSFVLPVTADLNDAVIEVTVTGEEEIPSQAVLVKNSIVDFNDSGPDLIGTEPGPAGAIDALQREGQSFGFFDWNSGGEGAQTISVYRVTGLPAGEEVPFTVVLENSNADGTYSGTVTGDETGEAVLVSTSLAGALPAGVVRYDFGINFEIGDDLDVDRLLSRGGVVTAFNGGANSDPSGNSNTPLDDTDNEGTE